MTAEQLRTQRRLIELDVEIVTAHALARFDGREAVAGCIYTGRERRLAADAVVLVTAREPREALYRALRDRVEAGAAGAPRTLRRFGDCDAPGLIATAVHAGHGYARGLDAPEGEAPVPVDRVFDETV